MGKRYDCLKRVVGAWSTGDIEGVLALMGDDIVWHFAAAALPPVRGKAAARKLLQRFSKDMLDIRWKIFAYAETEDRLFVEGVDNYTTPEGRTITAPYAGVLDFRGELIVGWRDYVDTGVVAAQRDNNVTASPQVIELISRQEAV